MSVIPKITCRRCGREYSGLRSRCPYCGTGRSRSAERIPLRTSSENAGTPAAEHAAVNTKWQMLFGGILLIAVVAAVIVLITVSLNAGKNASASAAPTPPATVSSAAPVTTPTPTPEPTPTPTPTPSVTSITITFLGSKRTEFAAKVGHSHFIRQKISFFVPRIRHRAEFIQSKQLVLFPRPDLREKNRTTKIFLYLPCQP